jgi:D-3-phosphoglycerate dehydrogenase / 2-oxoglutarate reductase
LSVLLLQGSVLLTRQRDQPGIVAGVSSVLAEENINISFMTVGRTGKDQEAIMAIGIDSEPTDACVGKVAQLKGIKEAVVFREAA